MKEHLWSGKCAGTEDIMTHWKKDVIELEAKYNIKTDTSSNIMEAIEGELSMIDTNTHTLENHGRAAALFGLWNNNTLLKIKAILVEDEWEPGKAMGYAIELMGTMQSIALLIAERFKFNKTIFTQDILPEECINIKDINLDNTDKKLIPERIRILTWNEWYISYKENGLNFNTWEGQAYIKDEANKKGVTENEAKMEAYKAKGAKKAKITKEIKAYKRWREEPIEALEMECLEGKGPAKRMKKNFEVFKHLKT